MTPLQAALAATLAMLVGYASGRRRKQEPDDVYRAVAWHDHVHSAMWVARRKPGPDFEETQEMAP